MQQTITEFDEVIASAKNIFINKTIDYGTSWRVLRPISVVDQLYIKAKRIRNLQEGIVPKVADDISIELYGIINYAIIGHIQLTKNEAAATDLTINEATEAYQHCVQTAKTLMLTKNNDYGEAWREMSEESLIDLILMKLYRMKQIIRNHGLTIVSEGLDANYLDILNYAVFALILKMNPTK